MSHWRKFNSQVLNDINKDILSKALANMVDRQGNILNLTFDESITNIRNTWGHETVSASLVKDGKPIALGFNFKEIDGKIALELSGDFFGTGLNESSFIDQLSQNYQRYRVEQILEENSYSIESITTNEEGEIEMIAEMWA